MHVINTKTIGFVMIEVLSSMGIMSIVFLSLLAYQISLFKNSVQLNWQAIAYSQLMNFSDMLLANADNDYRQRALNEWNTDNASLLPNGVGGFTNNNHECQIYVNWFSGKSETQRVDVFC